MRHNKMHSIISAISVIGLFALTGCVRTMISTPMQPKEIIVKVESADPANVEVSEDGIQHVSNVPNYHLGLSIVTRITDDEALMTILGKINLSDISSVWKDFKYLEENTSIRKVTILLSSEGGSVFTGLGLCDEIERVKKKGFHITVYASGLIASAAVPILSVCDRRISSPSTAYMIHPISITKQLSRDTQKELRRQDKLIDMLKEEYIQRLVDHTKLDWETWEEMIEDTKWFDAEKAKQWGLIDEIL